MAMQRPRVKRTAIKFAVQNTIYTKGGGASTSWVTISAVIGQDENGNNITTDCFYCEWLNSYGAAAIQQQSDGVNRPARVRMSYVDVIYNALISKSVKIYKDGIDDALHTFQLASAADNYIESNKMIEFNVKLFEVR